MRKLLTTLFMITCLSPALSLAAKATALESLTVMALGPLDGRAVVRTSDGKMQVLKIGDTIPGTKAVVTQVLTDKLVVEEMIEKDKQSVAQTVWLWKPKKAGEKSQVQRLDREGPPKQPTVKPVVIEPGKAKGKN